MKFLGSERRVRDFEQDISVAFQRSAETQKRTTAKLCLNVLQELKIGVREVAEELDSFLSCVPMCQSVRIAEFVRTVDGNRVRREWWVLLVVQTGSVER